MDKKTKIWIAVLLSVVLLGLLGFFALSRLGGGTIAVITVDGQEYQRIDLSRVTESYDIEIDTKYGYNTVDGEEIYFIPNPALGLWINREKFEA